MFFLGFLFSLLVQPIAEGLSALVLTFFELIKSHWAITINKNNQLIHGGKESVHAIGFCAPDEEEYDDDDDE